MAYNPYSQLAPGTNQERSDKSLGCCPPTPGRIGQEREVQLPKMGKPVCFPVRVSAKKPFEVPDVGASGLLFFTSFLCLPLAAAYNVIGRTGRGRVLAGLIKHCADMAHNRFNLRVSGRYIAPTFKGYLVGPLVGYHVKQQLVDN